MGRILFRKIPQMRANAHNDSNSFMYICRNHMHDMPNKLLKAFEELEAVRRKLANEKLAEAGISPEEIVLEEIPADPIFSEPLLPERFTIQYVDFCHAAMATIKLIPIFHRYLGGVTTVTSNKKYKEFIIYTHSKHQITVSWKHASSLKRLDKHFREDSFRVMMRFLIEMTKLDNIQTELNEDPAFKIFRLTINQVPLQKSTYEENNIRDLKHLRLVKENIVNNPTPTNIQEDEAYRYACELISIYNSIQVPERLNLNIGYKYKAFEKTERIRVSSKKLPTPKLRITKPSTVGTCLTITSDRDDRFDHDD